MQDKYVALSVTKRLGYILTHGFNVIMGEADFRDIWVTVAAVAHQHRYCFSIGFALWEGVMRGIKGRVAFPIVSGAGRRGNRRGVGYTPVISMISEGVANTTLAVVSGDRRYVRLTVNAVFSSIIDVATFSFRR